MEDTTDQDKAFLDAFNRVSEIHRTIVLLIRRNPQATENDKLVLTPLESILNFARLIDTNSYQVNEADLEKQIAVVTRGLLDIVAIYDREMPEIVTHIKPNWLDKFVHINQGVLEKINAINASKETPEKEPILTNRVPVLPPFQESGTVETVNRWLPVTPFMLAMLIGLIMIVTGIFIFPVVMVALVIPGVIVFLLGFAGILVRK